LPTSFDDLSGNRFQEDLELAAGYKPILRSDLRKAYARFKPVGVKVGQIKHGMSDARLYRKATRDVIDWWNYQQRQKERNARIRRQNARIRQQNQVTRQHNRAIRNQP
jgi:hypothetical protein